MERKLIIPFHFLYGENAQPAIYAQKQINNGLATVSFMKRKNRPPVSSFHLRYVRSANIISTQTDRNEGKEIQARRTPVFERNLMYNTVIFDMDGTLYDTERIYMQAWLAAGVPEKLYYSFIGTSSGYIYDALTRNGLNADQVIADKVAYVNRELDKGIPLKPGALDTLKWLKQQGWKTAIATSSRMEVADRYLDDTDMRSYFTEVISGYQLEHGKPAPDIFLLAADRLHSAPAQSIVVEDSFNGVRAGHAAGMYTVMIPDLVQPDDEICGLADIVLPSMTDFLHVLKAQ